MRETCGRNVEKNEKRRKKKLRTSSLVRIGEKENEKENEKEKEKARKKRERKKVRNCRKLRDEEK